MDNDCDGSLDDNRVPEDYATLEDAVDGVADGGEVCVGAGSYTEFLDLSSRQLTFTGAGGTANTFLELGASDSPLFTMAGSGGELVLQGFTIRGGDRSPPFDSDDSGALAHVEEEALVLRDLEVRENTWTATDQDADLYGGLVYMQGGELTVESMLVEDNTWAFEGVGGAAAPAMFGGLIYGSSGTLLTATDVTMNANTVSSEDEPYGGGITGLGLYVEGDSVVSLQRLALTKLVVDVETAGYDGFSMTGALAWIGVDSVSLEDVDIRDNEISIAVDGRSAYFNGLLYLSSAEVVATDVVLDDNAVALYAGSDAYECNAQSSGLFYVSSDDFAIDHFQAYGNTVTAEYDGTNGKAWVLPGIWRSKCGSYDDCAASHIDIRGNVVAADSDIYGVAVFWQSGSQAGDQTLRNTILAGNTGEVQEGAIYGGGLHYSCSYRECSADFDFLSVYGNELTGPEVYGAGLYVNGDDDDTFSLRNSTVTDNVVTGAVTSGADIWVDEEDEATVDSGYCNLGDLSGMSPASTDLGVDPGFTDVSGSDPTTWDLSLQSSSELVDAGDPGEVDTDGSTCDIGAYGGEDAAW